MARLRREEEERSYQRMIQKAPPRESFAQRFPNAPMAEAFAAVNKPSKASDVGDDTFEYGDVQKQITLLFNFLVSIIGCAAALWLAARWWSTPARLFLSMGGSIVVAIAEVAVYSAYNWRMNEGERKEKKKREVKEIVKSWVVGEDEQEKPPELLLKDKVSEEENTLRRRVKDPS
jgi:TMEM199 family protein